MFVYPRGSVLLLHAACPGPTSPNLKSPAYAPSTTQLRKTGYALKNSPTVVTPRWRELCKARKIKDKNMPLDVRTHWNSTYVLLEFAVEYHEVIDNLTSERGLELRDYEMDPDEWQLAKQLRYILKVSAQLSFTMFLIHSLCRYLKMPRSSSQDLKCQTSQLLSQLWTA